MAKSTQSVLYTDETKKPKQFRGYLTVFVPKMEEVRNVSVTIPDMSMSISTMLQRTRAGLPINSGGAQPIWNGVKLLPNWKALDEIDRAAIVKTATAQAEKLKRKKESLLAEKSRLDAEAKAKFEAQQQEMRQKEIKDLLAASKGA